MSRQTLRELAKDYAKGVIDKDKYRKSRTELIQGIVARKIAVKPIDFVEPLRPTDDSDEDITQGRERDFETTQITSPDQVPSKPKPKPEPATQQIETKKVKKNKSNHLFIIISIIFVLALIFAVVLFYPKPPEAGNSASTTSELQLTTGVAEILIGKFLNEKDWSDTNRNNFIESWNALSQEDRDAAAGTNRLQRLKATVYDQFLKGKALASIDAEKAIEKQQKLIDFANAIGIEDSRLTIE